MASYYGYCKKGERFLPDEDGRILRSASPLGFQPLWRFIISRQSVIIIPLSAKNFFTTGSENSRASQTLCCHEPVIVFRFSVSADGWKIISVSPGPRLLTSLKKFSLLFAAVAVGDTGEEVDCGVNVPAWRRPLLSAVSSF